MLTPTGFTRPYMVTYYVKTNISHSHTHVLSCQHASVPLVMPFHKTSHFFHTHGTLIGWCTLVPLFHRSPLAPHSLSLVTLPWSPSFSITLLASLRVHCHFYLGHDYAFHFLYISSHHMVAIPVPSLQHTRYYHLICFSSLTTLDFQYDSLASSSSFPAQALSVPFPACFCLPSCFIRFSLPLSLHILSPCCWSVSPHFCWFICSYPSLTSSLRLKWGTYLVKWMNKEKRGKRLKPRGNRIHSFGLDSTRLKLALFANGSIMKGYGNGKSYSSWWQNTSVKLIIGE